MDAIISAYIFSAFDAPNAGMAKNNRADTVAVQYKKRTSLGLLREVGKQLVPQADTGLAFNPGQQWDGCDNTDHVRGPLGIHPYACFLGQVPEVPDDGFEGDDLVPGGVAEAANRVRAKAAVHCAAHVMRLDLAVQPYQVADFLAPNLFLDRRYLHDFLQ